MFKICHLRNISHTYFKYVLYYNNNNKIRDLLTTFFPPALQSLLPFPKLCHLSWIVSFYSSVTKCQISESISHTDPNFYFDPNRAKKPICTISVPCFYLTEYISTFFQPQLSSRAFISDAIYWGLLLFKLF